MTVPRSPTLPNSIGRYRIIGVLGEGGMGTVYEAEQDQPHRIVALKVIRPDFASPELVRRFARESDVLGRLQHPGIAQIYEAGIAEGPRGQQSFFAMELVRGQPLTAYAAERSLEINQRLEVFTRICDAVHYAHQQGVIHRDLKPANILIDSSGQPKILDFGVARLTDADVQATRQTSVGEVIGTLQYMSPEQVNADPGDIDTRSDVYSLGVVLYELLSGQLPYDLAQKMIYQAARTILVDDPAPLSTINRKLGGDVEVIVGKALEKEKERRYASAEAMASDVRLFLAHQPIAARPASAVYQLRKFARRNRALVTGLGLAALILVAGTVVSVWQAVRATAAERLAETRRGEAVAAGALAERRRAVADSALLVADSARAIAIQEQAAATASAARATGEAAKAQAVNAFLQQMLASSDPANARGQELSVRELLDQASAGARTANLTRQPEVGAAIEATIGRTYFGLGLYDQARPHLDSAYAIRRRTLGRSDLSFAESARDVGTLASAAGDFALAEQRLTEGLAIKRAKLQPDDDRITDNLALLADVRYSRGDNAGSERLHREALRLSRARHGNTGVQVALRLRSVATILTYTGRSEEAEPLFEESLRMLRQAYGDNHPEIVGALVSLGEAKQQHRDFPGAEATFREALPIANTVYAQEHPSIANVVSRLGGVLTDQRRLQEAEPLLRDAIAMRVKLLGEQHLDVQLARVNLGRLLVEQRKYDEADTVITKALVVRRAALGDSSPAVASTIEDLARVANERGDWAVAAERYREAIPIWQAAGLTDEVVTAQAGLGWALYQAGKIDEAEPILNEVAARQRARYGNSHALVGDAYEKLAGVVVRRGRFAEGESLSALGLGIRRAVYGARAPQVAGQLLNMAFLRERQADTAGAIPFLRESLSISQERRPPPDPTIINTQRWLATDLCATGAAQEGEPIARTAMANLSPDSTQALLHRVRGALGYCLIRQARFADAEPLLLQSEAALRGLPSATPAQRSLAVGWLVTLYEQWGKPEEAAKWRDKR